MRRDLGGATRVCEGRLEHMLGNDGQSRLMMEGGRLGKRRRGLGWITWDDHHTNENMQLWRSAKQEETLGGRMTKIGLAPKRKRRVEENPQP